jgi:2-polyprenyl-3-methyl-5-hydroxy-6-metoxy-1,4-benzoquinol methylase
VYWGADRKFIELQPNHEMENQIVCINRITYYKRQDLLIDAVAKSKTKPKLVIIGDGDPEFKQIIISKAKNLGVDLEIKKLNFETYAEDKIAEIKKSKALISTSYYEGFGISPAEAIMCNRIPLLNDIPVFREIYKDDAKYFHNVDELAETIDWIMTIMDRDYIVPENSKERLDIDRVANTINLIMGDYIKQSLGKKVRENIDDRKVYSSAYDIEHIRDYQFSSHRYNPDWERHWRVPYARESLIGKKVLDIGCSYGAYTIHFVRNGFDVTAADCSPVALHQCKENLLKYGFEDKVRLVETFSDKMPFSDGEFDSIWAGEIVEHIPEHLLDASMREFIRVVRKGGRLVFSVPIGTHHNDPLHLRIFDDNSIKALFENYADLINIVKIEKIGEGDLDKSCYFIVADKK